MKNGLLPPLLPRMCVRKGECTVRQCCAPLPAQWTAEKGPWRQTRL